MDYELIKTAVLALNMLLTVSLAGLSYSERRQRATLKVLEKRLDEKCVRLAKLEAEIKDFPTKIELVRVHERIDVLITDFNKNSRENNLLLGEISGQIKQISLRLAHD